MKVINSDEAKNICLYINNYSKMVEPDSEIYLECEIVNNTSYILDSMGETPLYISYHWFDCMDKEAVHDGIRTPILPLKPHMNEKISVRIQSPEQHGKYLLCLTFVQENVQWFNSPDINNMVLLPFEIQEFPWWTDTEQDKIVFGSNSYLNKLRYKKYFEYNGMCRPLFLHIETVNICNLNCIICPCSKMTRNKETMSMELFKKVICDYVNMGGGDVILTPQIGDIFLDKLLPERITYLNSVPEIHNYGFITNAIAASRYSDEELAYIVNSCARINISIYGMDEEEYSIMTSREGMYNQMLTSVKRIIGLNRKTMIVFGFRNLHKRSDQEIKEWIVNNFGQDIVYEVITDYCNWAGAKDVSISLPYDATWLPITAHDNIPCMIPLLYATVFVNGNVKFCSCTDYDDLTDNTLGNIMENDLASIYNSGMAKEKWKHGLTRCATCNFYNSMVNIDSLSNYFDAPLLKLGM